MASSLEVSGHSRSHSQQSYQHPGSRCISEPTHPIQKLVRSHDRHPKTLCEGNHVRVFSRSSGKWVHGKITKIEDNRVVRVEYEFKDDTYGKDMHVDSEHLIIPCQSVDSDLTSNKYQYDPRNPTCEIAQKPEQWGKSCPKASGLNSHGCLTPSESEYSEKDPEIGFVDKFKNPFCLTPSESEYSEKDPEIGFFDNFKNPFRSGPWKVTGDRGRLSEVDGNREWIVTSTRPADVKKRKKAAMDTLRACEQGYTFDGRPGREVDPIRLVGEMSVRNYIIMNMSRPLRSYGCSIYWTTGDPLDVVEEAQARRDPGPLSQDNLVALATAVSANCGGFLTGGVPNFEESLCMRTTLFQSLQKEFNDQGQIVKRAVVRRWVHIFRGSYAEGYPFLDADELSFLYAVVIVSMPDGSRNLIGAGPQRQNERKHHRFLEEKMDIMMNAALESGCTELVIPEVGHGYCANDRWDLGFALGRTLAGSLATATPINRVTLVGDHVSNQDFADGVLAGGQFGRLNIPATLQDGEPILLASLTRLSP